MKLSDVQYLHTTKLAIEKSTDSDGFLTRTDAVDLVNKFAPIYRELHPLIEAQRLSAIDELKEINAFERFELIDESLQLLQQLMISTLTALVLDGSDLTKMYGDYFRFDNDKGEWMTMGYKFNLHIGEDKPMMFEIIIRDDKPNHSDPLGIGMK